MSRAPCGSNVTFSPRSPARLGGHGEHRLVALLGAPAPFRDVGLHRLRDHQGQERVPAARPRHSGSHRRRPALAEPLAQQLTDRPVLQGSQCELVPWPGQGLGASRSRRRFGSRRDQDTQPARVDVAAEREAEAADAGWSSHCRSSTTSVTGSASQSCVSSPRTASGTAKASISPSVSARRSATSRRAPLRPRQSLDGSLRALVHQLGQPGERQSTVELGRSDRQHPSAAALRQLIRDLQQTALPDTRLADGDHAAALSRTSLDLRTASSRPNRP